MHAVEHPFCGPHSFRMIDVTTRQNESYETMMGEGPVLHMGCVVAQRLRWDLDSGVGVAFTD